MSKIFKTFGILPFVFFLTGCPDAPPNTNTPPTAEDDTLYTIINTSVTHNLTTNDTDSDGTIDVATVLITTNPSNGSLNILGTGEVTYTPNPNFTGNDTFNYKVDDDGGLMSNVADVNVTVDLDTDSDGIGNKIDSDDDNDSITDVNETANGTDPLDSDSDDDGMDDGQEATNGTNPLSTDTDGDGLLDGAEGTLDADNDAILDALESNSTDTDGDGVPDQLDNENLNPNNDTDGDGISNSIEVNNGTNPQNTDSDGDGQSDGVEGEIDSDGDGIIDALESDAVDSDGDGVMDEEDAGNNDPNIGALVVQDACAELHDGVYAYEEWRSYNATADDAYSPNADSDFKELKINVSNILNIKEDQYTSASTFTTSVDSSAANWVSATSSGFIVDMATLTTTPIGDIVLFPAGYTGCHNNVASFSGYGGLLGYDVHLSGRDISGEFILDIYPDLEVEIADSATNPTKTFSAGSKLLVGEIISTQDLYLLEEDAKTQVTDGIGNAFTTVNWTNVSTLGQVFKYDNHYTLTIVNDGTLTLLDGNDNSTRTGTWALVGSGSTQYLQTTITNDPQEGNPFLAVLNGALRVGYKSNSGMSVHIGTEPDDAMDEIMFNKVAMEEIQTYTNPAVYCVGDSDCAQTEACIVPQGSTSGTCQALVEIPNDGVDNDNDGLTDCDDPDVSLFCSDIDGDGFTPVGGDCDDTNASIYPGASEVLDGVDNNCNNQIDEGDSDNDGLSDALESGVSNYLDADSDDDGIIDGNELSGGAFLDSDGDNLYNQIDFDSDNDGLPDGLEAGITTPNTDTDVRSGHFIADLDPTTTTYIANSDTDGDGLLDGLEDANHNGRVDTGETDPNDADTDNDTVNDSLDSDPLDSNVQ